MNRMPKWFVLAGALMLAALVLAACGGQTAAPEPTEAPTEAPVATVAPPATEAPAAAVTGDPARGEALFNQATIGPNNAPGCKTCHSLEPGVTIVGPSLAGMAEDAREDNPADPEGFLRETIVDPNAEIAGGFEPNIMYQNYGQDLSEQDIADLVAFLMTQEGGGTEASETHGNPIRGGQLYDKWWKVTGAAAPTEVQPLWQGEAESAAATWRCKECHGWTYTGKGDYPGLMQLAGADPDEIMAALTGATNPDHDFSTVMEDEDLYDLAVFISEKMYDVAEITSATGDAAAGEATFGANCAVCHGPSGMAINFHHAEPEPPEYIPTMVQEDPGEFLNKAHWGQPGHPEMPAGDALGFTPQDYADMMAYLGQFPTTSPLTEGGQLYDNWWKAAVVDEPTGEMPLWATRDESAAPGDEDNLPTGSKTWRCAVCHGWDYQGDFGFPGLWEAQNKSADEILAALTGQTNPDHDFSQVLDADRLNALVTFIQEGLVDKSQYINADGTVNGDAAHGEQLFVSTCVRCHGTDGTEINFHAGTDEPPEYVGTVAQEEALEFLNKASFGQPGEAMPAGLNMGWSWQDIADLLAYAQSLPGGE